MKVIAFLTARALRLNNDMVYRQSNRQYYQIQQDCRDLQDMHQRYLFIIPYQKLHLLLGMYDI